MDREIKSINNDLVKFFLQLQSKSRLRKREGLFVVEGRREIELAMDSGHRFRTFFYCEEIIPSQSLQTLKDKASSLNPEWVKVSQGVYEHMAHRKTTEGLLGIGYTKDYDLGQLKLGENPVILVAEASEKPGNIGALLRTADAAAVDAVILADPLTDLYNPNIIRSSVGCVFSTQIAMADSPSIVNLLREKGIRSFAAVLGPESKPYHLQDFTKPVAIIVGTEATGLSEVWLENADERIIIPMSGSIDSLNVSVSAAILIFEAKRQRDFKF